MAKQRGRRGTVQSGGAGWLMAKQRGRRGTVQSGSAVTTSLTRHIHSKWAFTVLDRRVKTASRAFNLTAKTVIGAFNLTAKTVIGAFNQSSHGTFIARNASDGSLRNATQKTLITSPFVLAATARFYSYAVGAICTHSAALSACMRTEDLQGHMGRTGIR
jgi:hypothetical protein